MIRRVSKYEVTSNSPLCIIDGSPLLYIHGGRFDFKSSIEDHIETILRNCNTDLYIGFLDGDKNYRKDTYPDYKGNRNRDKDELLAKYPFYYRCKDLLINEYGMMVADNVESDDLIGVVNGLFTNRRALIAGRRATAKDAAYVCSIDKDLMQLPCNYYNIKTHEHKDCKESKIELNEKKKIEGSGDKFLWSQCLMGDSVDNIKGIPKTGPVKAYNTLCNADDKQCEQIVKDAYKAHYGDSWEAEMNLNYSMVYILRKVEELSGKTSTGLQDIYNHIMRKEDD